MADRPSSDDKPKYHSEFDDDFAYDRSSSIYKPVGMTNPTVIQVQLPPQPFVIEVRRDLPAFILAFLAVLISLGTFAVVGAYTYITFGQWTEMKKATEAAEKAARAAETANINSTNALHLTERAWVGMLKVDGRIQIAGGEPTDLKITYVNSGKVPALNLHIATQTACEAIGTRPRITYTEEKALRDGRSVLIPGAEMVTEIKDEDLKDPCSPQNTELLREKKAVFYVLGTLWYQDGFGKGHHTDFCSYLKVGKTGAIPCTFHNEAD